MYNMTPAEMVKQWPLMAALWLMEEPDLVKKNFDVFVDCVGSMKRTDSEFMQDMLSAECFYVERAIAASEQASIRVLKELAENEDEEVVAAVAGNEKTPRRILAKLSKHRSKTVKRQVSKNPNTPNSVLSRLIGSGLDDAIAQNENIDSKNVSLLLRSADKHAIYALCRNESLSADMLHQIVDVVATRYDLRGCLTLLAWHQNANEELLKKVIQHDDFNAAASINIAKNKKTPISLLELLSKKNNPDIRQGVAQNECTPVHVLMQLAQDSSDRVRQDVCRNPATTGEVLAMMAQDHDRDVLWLIGLNKNSSQYTLFVAYNKAVARGANTNSFASNPKSPVAILKKLALDQSKTTREYVIKNPSSTKEVVNLAEKDNIYIANLAAGDKKQEIMERLLAQSWALSVLHDNDKASQESLSKLLERVEPSRREIVEKEILEIIDNRKKIQKQ